SPFPQGIPPYAIPFLQSRSWERLGNLDVALRFMREAERLDPAQGICVLILLEKLGRKDEAETYANRFLGEHGHGAVAALGRGGGFSRGREFDCRGTDFPWAGGRSGVPD